MTYYPSTDPAPGVDLFIGPSRDTLTRVSTNHATRQARIAAYNLYRAYFDGEHAPQVPSNALQSLQRYTRFKLNICKPLVQATSRRLKLTGFIANDQADTTVGEVLTAIWKQNKLDSLGVTLHTNAVKLGDAYLIVEWDADRNRARVSYNDPAMIDLEYADTGNTQLLWASKTWVESDIMRRNIYYPDHVDRWYAELPKDRATGFIDKAENWIPFDLDGYAAVQPWLDKYGDALGVAVIPFRYQSYGDPYGRSGLQDVIPIQDGINKAQVDLFLNADSQGWPQYWASGIDGEPPGGFNMAPGSFLTSANENFKVGQMTAADPQGMLAILNFQINSACGVTSTPQHVLHIEQAYPSAADTFRAAETGLVSKCYEAQEEFGAGWEDVAYMILRLREKFLGEVWNTDDLILESVWKKPEMTNDLLRAQAISTIAPWYSDQQVLREDGKNEQEISAILEERRQNKAAFNQAQATQLDAAFTEGTNGGMNTFDPDATEVPTPPDSASTTDETLTLPLKPGGQGVVNNPDRR